MVKIILLVLAAEILGTIGHLLFKKTTNMVEAYDLKKAGNHLRFLRDVFAKPSIWLGLAACAAGRARPASLGRPVVLPRHRGLGGAEGRQAGLECGGRTRPARLRPAAREAFGRRRHPEPAAGPA